MKKKINMLAAALITSSMILVSCGGEYGENAESNTGNYEDQTQETGSDLTGDQPGTAADDTSTYVNEVIGDDNAAEADSL